MEYKYVSEVVTSIKQASNSVSHLTKAFVAELRMHTVQGLICLYVFLLTCMLQKICLHYGKQTQSLLTFHCLLYYLIGIKLLLLEDIGGYIDGLLDKHVRPFMFNTIYAYEHSILTPR